MTTPEPIWQLSELRNGTEPMLFRKLLDAIPTDGLSGSDYVVYLTFGCDAPPAEGGYYTPADTSTLADIDETDIPDLETATGALLVGAVSAPRVRDFIFYTDDPQRFLDAADSIRSRFTQFQIGCECIADPEWQHYRELPPEEE